MKAKRTSTLKIRALDQYIRSVLDLKPVTDFNLTTDRFEIRSLDLRKNRHAVKHAR